MKTIQLLTTVALSAVTGLAAAQTLESVQDKGYLQCGVSQGLPGFSNTDDAGNWVGIDVDYCRALAAAVLGDADAVRYTPLSASARFSALTSGEIDVLSRNTTYTMTRDTQQGIDFVGVTFYDGQGIMVRKELGVSSALELDGASVCTNTGTTTELNISDYFRANGMEMELVAFETSDDVVAAYDAGRCDAYTTDKSGLAAQGTKLSNPDAHMILPETLSKEPLGPAVRHGDQQWGDIARWTLLIMLEAEELGVSSANVEAEQASPSSPAIGRLLGVDSSIGEGVGLGNDFGFHIISQVGNYGEIYETNVEPLIPRAGSLNALYTEGGIMYSAPVR
jgi:general L-amino acid transport system substrate-binding protein